MPIARINGKTVYFAHVPKAAGSAVEHYLQERFGRLAFRNTGYGRKPEPQRWTRSSPQHVDFGSLIDVIPMDFFDAVFTVVRHPVPRLRSVYHYQRDWEKTLPQGMGFTDWLRSLPEEWATNRFHLDNHPRPMAELVPPQAKMFRVEDGLGPMISWINVLAGDASGPGTIGRVNVTADRAAKNNAVYDPVKISAEDIALIAQMYEKDFRRFGYTPDWSEAEPMQNQTSHSRTETSGPPAVLVFGKTGQVATELQRHAGVTTLGRDMADLSDPEACAEAIRTSGAEVVINAAAYTAVDRAEEEEDLATVINGEAPTAMARAAAEKGIPFIHISTDYVFDGAGEKPFHTYSPTGPLNAYGRSKLKGEEGVRAAGGTYAILRTSWVFSAHGNNFVKTMLRLGKERDMLSIVADQVGGPTAARDIAAACVTMAHKLVARQGASGTYHFSGAPDTSWAGFARGIFERAGLNVEVKNIPSSDFPTPAARPGNSRMNCSDLTEVFGIPRPDWRESLNDVLKDLGEI